MTRPINFIIFGPVNSGTTTALNRITLNLERMFNLSDLPIPIDDAEPLTKNLSKITKTEPIAPILIGDYLNTWPKSLLPAVHGSNFITNRRGREIDVSNLRFTAIVTYKRSLDSFVDYTKNIFPEFEKSDIDFIFKIKPDQTIHIYNQDHSVDITNPYDPENDVYFARSTIDSAMTSRIAKHLK